MLKDGVAVGTHEINTGPFRRNPLAVGAIYSYIGNNRIIKEIIGKICAVVA